MYIYICTHPFLCDFAKVRHVAPAMLQRKDVGKAAALQMAAGKDDDDDDDVDDEDGGGDASEEKDGGGGGSATTAAAVKKAKKAKKALAGMPLPYGAAPVFKDDLSELLQVKVET